MTTRHRACDWLLPAVVCAWACAAPAAAQASEPAVAEAWHYRVARGDTLYEIAALYLDARHGWQSLQTLNKVADPLRLEPGSTLRIPLAWLRRSATVAELVFVQGDVGVQAAGAEVATPASAGTMLQAGSVIRTGSGASATLRFADGSRLLIVADSRVALERLLVYGRSGLPDIRLRLDSGGADSSVVPQTGQRRGYQLRTPAVNLGVRGTQFRTRVDGDGAATRVEVLQGNVAAGSRTSVGAGYGTLAEAGQPPRPPAPLLPAPDLSKVPALVDRVPLGFAWPALPGAAGYRAQVLADSDDERLLLDGRSVEPSVRFPDLPDGRYRLRVRGLDAQALEGRDAGLRFTLKARPEPPFVTAPPPAAALRGDEVEFAWARSDAAASYRLQVFAEDRPDEPLVDRRGLAEARLVLPLAPGRYRWRVASETADGDLGPYGDTQAFTLQPAPPLPSFEAPQSSDDGLLLRWRAPPPGESVQFQVATDAGFEHILIDQRDASDHVLLPRPAPGRYYLRSRGVAADGYEGAYGAVQQLDVPPPALSRWWLLAPAGLLWLLL